MSIDGNGFLRPRNDAPEGFDAPWQAEACGIGQALIEAGHVSAEQWARTLNRALRQKLEVAKRPDDAETHCAAIVEALDLVTSENALLSADEVDQRAEAWRSAYRRTPHGKPVDLG